MFLLAWPIPKPYDRATSMQLSYSGETGPIACISMRDSCVCIFFISDVSRCDCLNTVMIHTKRCIQLDCSVEFSWISSVSMQYCHFSYLVLYRINAK